MLLISLDEYGNFEKEEKKPMFIAGLIYDDEKTHTERKRIRAYYRKVMEEAGAEKDTVFSYPEDLHSDGDPERNKLVISAVKAKVAETLPEFLSEGTYGHEKLYDEDGKRISARKGQYHLFVMLKSDDGKKKLLKSTTGILARDDLAGNRYFHMAASVINRIIFHNPLFPDDGMPEISVDAASRSTGDIQELDQKLAEEFEQEGYYPKETQGGEYQYYSITNRDVYRTLIQQEMVNSGRIRVKIKKVRVSSIRYLPDANQMEFLYLSDSICSFLSFNLERSGKSADNWLKEITDRTNTLNPGAKNLIFGYDEADNAFEEAWRCYERKDFFEALSLAWDAMRKKGGFARYYAEEWFPYLEERVSKGMTPALFGRSLDELSSMIRSSNLDQDKLMYLLRRYEEIAQKTADKYQSADSRERDLYKLYDACVSACCHIGDPAGALKYYEKCREHVAYTGMDAFLDTGNKLVVSLEDSFEWDRALQIAEENKAYRELISDIRQEVLKEDESTINLDMGKALSQLARIQALKRLPEAETNFRAALGKMEKGSANYKITQSYLLHYYADMGMEEAFEQEADDYFEGARTYNQRLRQVLSGDESGHAALSREYAMYVLLRGLFLFGRDRIDDSFWSKLCSLKEALTTYDGKEPGGHPWELSYKYLEMLAAMRGDEEAAAGFREEKRSCLAYKGDTLTVVELFGDAEAADFSGDPETRDRITEELAGFLKERFSPFRDKVFSGNGQERYHEMEAIFTFMYR